VRALKLKIAVDLTSLVPLATGTDRYNLGLIHALTASDRTNEYTLFVNRSDRERIEAMCAGSPNFTVEPVNTESKAARLFFQQVTLGPLRSFQFDVIHSPSFLIPLWRSKVAHVVTIHDMTFFTMPENHNRLHGSLPFKALVAASMRRAHAIQVPAEVVKDDVRRILPDVRQDRVHVIPYGVDARFSPDGPKGLTGVPSPYILFVGTVEPRKNLLKLVEAFRQVPQTNVSLVIAGKRGWNSEAVYEAAAAPAIRDRVHFTGYVSDSDLPALVRGARLFVYPSLYEGFGFPPLEAMASGVPAIISPGSAPEELFSSAAMVVDPANTASLASAIRDVLEESPDESYARVERGFELARRFSWAAMGTALVACYRELVEKKKAGA
jgi:glycosyltransferase involved in cell wall biosynthesis